jgi:glycosyltransferase involved in cell wall biosynthesis
MVTKAQPKVAITIDWILAGGAELVVLELHNLFPDAPIYTSYCTPEWRRRLDGRVMTGFLQKWPFSRLRKFLPVLRIWWFSRLDFTDYDIVISISGAEAKGIKVSEDTLHIAYINAPTHYYWSRYDEYLREPGFGWFDWLARLGLKILVKPLRQWDYRTAQKPDFIIANSTNIQEQVKKYYHRDSTVIFPPVNTDLFKQAGKKSTQRKGFIILGRQTPYKRFDLAVQACSELNLPLTVVGKGPEYEKLKAMAGPSVTFTGFVKDEAEKRRLVAEAEAFIFPGLDDFGIAPVEAMAAGTPVIAHKAGGALDYVTPGKTGEFFEEQTVESLKVALENFDSSKYSSRDISQASDKFSIEQFHSEIKNFTAKL